MILLGGICLVFVFFFGQSLDTLATERSYAAIVDGETITDRDFGQRYSGTYRRYQQQYQEFDLEQAKRMKLRENILDQMITSKILAKNVARRGMSVDNSALRNDVMNNENFYEDGKFSRRLYQGVLNANRYTEASYEAMRREELLQEKVALLANNSIRVSSNEAWDDYQTQKRSMNIEFIRIRTREYEGKAGDITQADITSWEAKADSADRIQKYYDKYKTTRYNTPKKIKARHIMIRSNKDDDAATKAAAKKRIDEAKAAVSGGLDFAAAASKFSEDSTKAMGGDLGFFSAGQIYPAVEKAAFAMNVGEISDIVESKAGFHIIRVEEIKEPEDRTLEQVKGEIARELATEDRASDEAKKQADEIYSKIKEGAAFADLAGQPEDPTNTLKAEETGTFSQGSGFIPKIGLNKDFANEAWTLTTENPLAKGPFKLEDGWIIYKVKERTEPVRAEFEKEKQTASGRLMFQKTSDVMEKWSTFVRSSAEVSIHPDATSYERR